MELLKQIEQWKQLKQSRRVLDNRLAELRNQILHHITPGEPVLGVDKQVRDCTTFSPDKVYAIMGLKAISEELFTKRVVDPMKVEALYLEGALNDDDLRHIRVPKYNYALIEVTQVEEEDV